ncbi:MAG TPA: hypothetical protein VIE15_05350, partial [Acidimicrobiales bacterium]
MPSAWVIAGSGRASGLDGGASAVLETGVLAIGDPLGGACDAPGARPDAASVVRWAERAADTLSCAGTS